MTIQRRDTREAFSTLEDRMSSLDSASIEDISECYSDVQSAMSSLESELDYLLSEHEDFEAELDEYRDCGFDDTDDVRRAYDIIDNFGGFDEAEESMAELESLRETASFVERDKQFIEQAKELVEAHEALKNHGKAQARVISALIEKLRSIHEGTLPDAISDLIFNAAQPDALPLLKQTPPNCS